LGTAGAVADPVSRALPFVLSLTAGAMDTIGFLGLNGLFTAHITELSPNFGDGVKDQAAAWA
jgi:uncharacterized membrane protein YoaK (UPF0700 family)